jgi:hypothetical protein
MKKKGKNTSSYINIVIQFNSPRTIQLNLLQGLAHHVVRLTLTLLDRADGAGFVQVAAIVNVQLAEGILQGEDVRLLELRVFSCTSKRVFTAIE